MLSLGCAPSSAHLSCICKSRGDFQNSNPLLMMDQKEINKLTDCLELQLNPCSKKNPKQVAVVDLLMCAQSVLISAVLKDTSLSLDSAEFPKTNQFQYKVVCAHLIINPKPLLGCTRKLLCGFQKHCKETKWPERRRRLLLLLRANESLASLHTM